MNVLMIDNYDSFTYNLYQYFGILGANVEVFRNDKLDINSINIKNYTHVVISPGPGRPANAGISKDIILRFKGILPILGVCLGHQVIGEVFGANVVRANKVMHGKTSMIYHNDDDIFINVEDPFVATRYHSLVIEKDSLTEDLLITAMSDDGEIMGIRHVEYPIWGIQFHPESILTKVGFQILDNFLKFQL